MEYLSWVCPDCKQEGDLRCALLADRCPACNCPVKATGHIMRNVKTGCIQISPDWVEASGYPDEGFVHVVRGQTGEYADQVDWAVKAYTSWERAKVHAVSAELRAYELCLAYADSMNAGQYKIVEGKNEFDPRMKVDYTGVEYCVDVVELED